MKIPLFSTYWDDDDVSAVTKVISRGSYWATGPEIKEFEEKITEYIGTKFAVVFNSGTSALHAILMAYDCKAGDEIIIPSFTFISTANAPLFVGAKPVFAEIEDTTYSLNPEDVKERITSKTKAIMPIHFGGCPAMRIKELKEIADDHNLLLIDDAAESFGAKIGDKKVGTFGDAAMFSFCQNKVISTGEGGVIVTDSKEIYYKLKLLVSHGRPDAIDYFTSGEAPDYITLGYNFRMPTMSAALGLSQIKKIDKIIQMRRKNGAYYTSQLRKIKGISTPNPPSDFFHVYQMYVIQVDRDKRDGLKEHLEAKGISTKVYFDPIHLTKFYMDRFGFKKGELPKTEDVNQKVLTLPMDAMLEENQIEYIAKSIQEFME